MSENRKPKVVHLTSVHSVFDSRIFQKECMSLAAHGYDVTLIGPHSGDEVVSGVKIVPVVRGRNRFSRVLVTAKEVVKKGLSVEGDLYHLHDPELLLWAHLLKKSKAVVVFDMHEDLPHQVRHKAWVPKLFSPLLSFVAKVGEKFLLRDLPVVMAEKSYVRSREWLATWVEVLNFPKLDWLAGLKDVTDEATVPKFGYLGGVNKERGSQVMIEALGLLNREGVQAGFDCVGPISPEHRLFLLEKAREYGLSGVDFPGYMEPQKGWARIAQCHVGLALLEPIPNYVDSYPTKMFEYMGLGIPVVVSDFPLYREVVEKYQCGLAVDPLDPEAVAKAMTFLVDNPNEAAEMGRRGQEAAVSQFSWKSEEAKLLSFYTKILS